MFFPFRICFTFPLIFVLFGVFFYFLYILVFGKDAEDDDDPTTDYVMLAIGLVGGSESCYKVNAKQYEQSDPKICSCQGEAGHYPDFAGIRKELPKMSSLLK